MGLTRDVVIWRDDFLRAQSFTTTPGENGWTIKDTSAAGTPTYLCVSDDAGAAKLTCEATSEAQIVTLFHNDVLAFRLDQLLYVEWNVLVAGIDAVTTLVWGVADEQNNTSDTVQFNFWFRMEGSVSTTNIVVETDDDVTNNDDKATGKTLAAAYKRCCMDFSYGLTDIRFFIDGSRVASGTTFSANASPSQRVQPYIQLQKASGTGVPSITADYVEIAHRLAA